MSAPDVCNVVGSTAAREADAVIQTRSGPEIGVASTKAFTAQIAALSVLALGLGAFPQNPAAAKRAAALLDRLERMPDLIATPARATRRSGSWRGRSCRQRDSCSSGRGVHYPIALEGALKLKEISYLHAEGYAAGEMKHGPIALIEELLPVIVVAPRDELFEKTLSNIEEVKARGGRVIA